MNSNELLNLKKDPCINCIVRVTCEGGKYQLNKGKFKPEDLIYYSYIKSHLCNDKIVHVRSLIDKINAKRNRAQRILNVLDIFEMMFAVTFAVNIVLCFGLIVGLTEMLNLNIQMSVLLTLLSVVLLIIVIYIKERYNKICEDVWNMSHYFHFRI
jgi:hypothetical protein